MVCDPAHSAFPDGSGWCPRCGAFRIRLARSCPCLPFKIQVPEYDLRPRIVYGRDVLDAITRWASDWDEQCDLLLSPVQVEVLDALGQVLATHQVEVRIVVGPELREINYSSIPDLRGPDTLTNPSRKEEGST